MFLLRLLPIFLVVLFGDFCVDLSSALEDSLLNHEPATPLSAFRAFQTSITKFSCDRKSKSRLRMPKDVLAQVPEFNSLDLSITFPNRSKLLHVHDMALNRAFFFSFIWQTFNESKIDAVHLPGLIYLYLSAAADVSANPLTINGSTLLYDVHKFYPNWFTALEFNTTLNLFGVRAVRFDNTFAGLNFLREPTMNAIFVFDLGAQGAANYTSNGYFNAPWYGSGPDDPKFIPEPTDREVIGAKKHQFAVDIWWKPTVRVSSNFFGPPYTGQLESDLPVRFTQPWFDCGSSVTSFNEWMTSSVSPIVDNMPRYGRQKNMIRTSYVAVAAMDTFFINVPTNLCPISLGNPSPNLLASSDFCKPSTVCEPIYLENVANFMPTRFSCRCAAGYRYPLFRSTPFLASEFLSSTKQEFKAGFRCEKIENQMLWPTEHGMTYRGAKGGDVRFARRKREAEEKTDETNEEHMDTMVKGLERVEEAAKVSSGDRAPTRLEYVHAVLREHLNGTSPESISLEPRAQPDLKEEVQRLVSTFSRPSSPDATPKLQSRHRRSTSSMPDVQLDSRRRHMMNDLFEKVSRINGDNCHTFETSSLKLPGSVAFGADKQFHNQAADALRLAHFLSTFSQFNRPDSEVGGIRLGQKLHELHVVGEAMAAVAGDTSLLSCGVFFDHNAFVDSSGNRRPSFGPLVYRKGGLAAGSFVAKDMTNFGGYMQKSWFRRLKERWETNTFGMTKFLILAKIRADPKRSNSIPHPKYPIYATLPTMEDGLWTEPYFDCAGPVRDWIITYAVPFFGSSAVSGKLEFLGVVTASVPLSSLNVNQCPGKFYEANYFKSTALCDKVSTFCKPTFGDGFQRGGYECHCRKGYEYPYSGSAFFFLGPLLENQYERMMKNDSNIFPMMKCREAGANHLNGTSAFLLTICFAAALTLKNAIF